MFRLSSTHTTENVSNIFKKIKQKPFRRSVYLFSKLDYFTKTQAQSIMLMKYQTIKILIWHQKKYTNMYFPIE